MTDGPRRGVPGVSWCWLGTEAGVPGVLMLLMTNSDQEIGSHDTIKAAWYAVQVKPHGEARVLRHLALKAIPSFLPFVEIVRLRGARRVARLEPLFPGYLFVQMVPWGVEPRAWHAVPRDPGRPTGPGA